MAGIMDLLALAAQRGVSTETIKVDEKDDANYPSECIIE